MTAWTDLVKKIYNENKDKPNFKLKDAMKLAKKQYKKSNTTKKGGNCPLAAAKVGGNCPFAASKVGGSCPLAAAKVGGNCPFAKMGGEEKDESLESSKEPEPTVIESTPASAPESTNSLPTEELGGKKKGPFSFLGFGGKKDKKDKTLKGGKKDKKDKKNNTKKAGK